MDKTARCSCGNLRITVKGKPIILNACNCTDCQIRTGSAFATNCYFGEGDIVSTEGASKSFEHFGDEGRSIVRRFCPECGTTVYWKAEIFPDFIGIAIGCFADPDFPEPQVSIWNKSKHHWVSFPEHWRHSDTQTFSTQKSSKAKHS